MAEMKHFRLAVIVFSSTCCIVAGRSVHAADALIAGGAMNIPPIAAAPAERPIFSLTDVPAIEPELPAHPFARGARYWTVTGGTSHDSSLGRIYLTQFSIDTYVADDFAIRMGATLGYADARQTDGGVQGGPELGFRWHLVNADRFSIYLDGSAATVIHENPMTPESLRFNFDLQAGLGATLQLDDATHLHGGVRWHHLSNARVRGKARNLGYDAPLFYLGIMRAF
jgi:hypothetical protein